MKTKILIGAALLFSAAAFAQRPGAEKQRKNTHGTTVSTEARSEMEAGIKGDAVSATASSKSQGSIHAGDNSSSARDHRRAEREARKQDQQEFVTDVKARAQAHKEDGANASADIRTEVESRTAILKQNRENAKEAKRSAKAERKTSNESVIEVDSKIKAGKSDKKTIKANRPSKVRGGAKVGTDVQINRPKVGARVRGTAGLGIL